jgi:hypothetical protein
MKNILIIITIILASGCSLFPKTPDEMKAWSERTYTICSDRDNKELFQTLVRQAAICHIGIEPQKVSDKRYALYTSRDIYLKGKQGDISIIETRLTGMKSIAILAEIQNTEECNAKIDFYFYNSYWEGAMPDYRSWINENYETCEF